MATVLNRATKQLIPSANTVEYPVADWIIEPDLSAVVGFASKYWTITGDVVSLMDQASRDALDAAELSAARDATAAALDQVESFYRAFAGVFADEINAQAITLNGILTAIDNGSTLAEVKTNVAAIADLPQLSIDGYKTDLRSKLGQ